MTTVLKPRNMVTSDTLLAAACERRRRVAILALPVAALAFMGPATLGPASASAAEASQRTFERDATRARNWLAQQFDRKLEHRIVVRLLDHDLTTDDGDLIRARTSPMSRRSGDWVRDPEEPYERCVIRISDFVKDRSRPYRRGLLAHELTHCFQYEAMGLKGVPRVDSRRWLTEGSAEWRAMST